MADREIDVVAVPSSLDGRYMIARAKASTNDTVSFRGITSISAREAFKESDGTELTTTVSTNVVTITTTSLTDESIVLLVWE